MTRGKVLSVLTIISAVKLMPSCLTLAIVSLLMIEAFFCTFPLENSESNLSFISVLSPTASTVLVTGAVVHPHPGLTFRILKVSVPIFLSQ